MSRKLIVFCDGTWNTKHQEDEGQSATTNVCKLHKALDPAATAEGTQKAIYLEGVGTGWGASIGMFWTALDRLTHGRLDPILGGSSGWGLSRQIRAGYAFLVENYQADDEIFIFGFSRGAFAARSLVGLLEHAGLLRKEAMQMIPRVTRAYHRLWRGKRHHEMLASVRSETHPAVRIRFLGVWDTVGALGVPIWGGSFSLNPLPWKKPRFHQVKKLDLVDEFLHAVAIDEQRAAYAPQFISSRPDFQPRRFEQVWFRGVHSNVGGGYAKSGLSDIALRWMVDRARRAGLSVSEKEFNSNSCGASQLPVLHDSLGSFWAAGVWPRGFPIASSPDDPEYDPAWGYLHASVNSLNLSNEKNFAPRRWLLTLAPGEMTNPISINAHKFWTNTRVVMRKGARYVISVKSEWRIDGSSCGPEGQSSARQRLISHALRKPYANLGELVLLVNAHPAEPPPAGKLWHALAYLFWKDPPYLVSLLETWNSMEETQGGRLFVPQRTGVLHCFANSPWSRQGANSGEIQICITRRS